MPKPGRNGYVSKEALPPVPSKWSSGSIRPEKGNLTWADADPEDLRDAIAAATEDGAAVLLSKTSDGGALHIQVWAGTDRPKFYAADMATLTAILTLIQDVSRSS